MTSSASSSSPSPKASNASASAKAATRTKGERAALIFVAVTLLGLGIWQVTRGGDLEDRMAVAERAFTPAEMRAHSKAAIDDMARATQDYARTLMNLPWPPASNDVDAAHATFRARLDTINAALAGFEVPATSRAAQLFYRLRSLAQCLRQTHVLVDAVENAIKTGVARPDYVTWLKQFDAPCEAARTNLTFAWDAFANE